MAQRVTVALVDDLEGGPAHETVRFGIGGSEYEIDLNKRNAARFRDEVAPYIAYARRAGRVQRRRPTSSSRGRSIGFEATRDRGAVLSDRSPRLGPLTNRVSSIDSYLTEQLAGAGISLTEGDAQWVVVQDVDFSFELRTTPSPCS